LIRPLQNTNDVLEAIGFIRSKAENVIGVIRKLGGKLEHVEPVKAWEFRYSRADTSITVSGPVHTLLQNPVIHAQMVHLVSTPLEQEGVTGIETYLRGRQRETEVTIEKADVAAFKSFSESPVPSPEQVREIRTAPTRYFLRPSR
jgi:phosphoribosylformylglycinamidine (FGAM) synthase PurS component